MSKVGGRFVFERRDDTSRALSLVQTPCDGIRRCWRDLSNAVASMGSVNLSKHPETRANDILMMLGIRHVLDHDAHAVRCWIEWFLCRGVMGRLDVSGGARDERGGSRP